MDEIVAKHVVNEKELCTVKDVMIMLADIGCGEDARDDENQKAYEERKVREVVKECPTARKVVKRNTEYYLVMKDDLWENYFMKDAKVERYLKARGIKKVDDFGPNILMKFDDSSDLLKLYQP